MSHRRIDNASGCGASITIAPYEYPLLWEFVGKGRYLQAAFCKATEQLYSTKFDKLTAKNLSNFAAKGAFLGLLEWSKDVGCCWDESVFVSGASGGNVEVLGYLLDNDCPFKKDATACTAAAANGYVDALMVLSLRGCKVNKYTFEAAARHGHLNVLQFAHKFRCDWDIQSIFNSAVRGSHLHILQWIHETVHKPDLFNDETSVFVAEYGKIEVLQWLRSVGCPWDARTIFEAIRRGNLRILKWAIEAGCPWAVDDREIGNDGRTALHTASFWGHAVITKYLLNIGANINALDDEARTPLFLAAWEGEIECVKVLLSAGADVNIVDVLMGMTPLGIALNEGLDEVAELIREAGGIE